MATRPKGQANPMLEGRVQEDLGREAARAKTGYSYGDEFFRKLIIYSADRLEGDMMRFFATHCDKFDVDGDEHRLEWTDLHKEYEGILDRHLQGFCDAEGITKEDFMSAVTEAADTREADGIVDTVVASADYGRFVELMKRRAALRRRK